MKLTASLWYDAKHGFHTHALLYNRSCSYHHHRHHRHFITARCDVKVYSGDQSHQFGAKQSVVHHYHSEHVYVHQPQFCIHFWVCGMPMCLIFCENSIDLYCTHLFSSWMIVHRPTDRSRFIHCNNTRGRNSSLCNFLSEYLTTLFKSKELEIL